MSQFHVSSDAVAQASASIADRVAEFESRVTALNSYVASLIGGDWSGTAADAFSVGWAEWFEGATTAHESLSKMSALLSSAAVRYEETEGATTTLSSQSLGDVRLSARDVVGGSN